MPDPLQVAKAFPAQLDRIRKVYGDGPTMAVIGLIDQRTDEAVRHAAPGSRVKVTIDWAQIDRDLQTHQATSVGQEVAAERAAKAEADIIRLTPDGLARVIQAARAEPDSTTDIEYSNLGETGKPTRITRRGRR